MKKKMILVAAPPACGKNYVSAMICKALGNVAYFDKDDLAPLLRRAFCLCHQPLDMGGSFYLEHLRPVEYETMMQQAFSAMTFGDTVLVNAPFLREVRDAAYMAQLKAQAESCGAQLILVWVVVSGQENYLRMKQRNSDRDVQKLNSWQAHLQNTDYTPPEALVTQGCVDKLFVFDNEDAQRAEASLKQFLESL